MPAKINLIGQRFGRLLVLEEAGRDKKGSILWKCRCSCPDKIIKIVRSDNLRNGVTKSCGCLQREIAFERGKLRVCDKHPMFGKHHTEETRQKMRDNHADVSGKNHPQYNPNLTDEERQGWRCIPGYKDWRKAVFERDNFTCQCCGKRGGNLCAHHLESYRDNPELRILLENGITLCEECHKNFHHQFGYGNTREQSEEFLRPSGKVILVLKEINRR